MRSPNLKPEAVEKILQLIDGWEGRLTWRSLVEAIRVRFGATYSRTALHYHPRIQNAFSRRRQKVSAPSTPRLTYTQHLRATLAKERERVRRSEADYDRLMEQTLTIITNAGLRGLSEEDMLRPLAQLKRASRRRMAGAPPAPGFDRRPKKPEVKLTLTRRSDRGSAG
jgi:hypothetical protein